MTPGPAPGGPPAVSFDRVAALYEATRRRPPEVEEAVTGALAGLLGRGRTLDVGVGTGRIAGPLLERGGAELVGVDVAAQMLRRARARGLRRLVRADARWLPFRDRSFRRSMTTHLLHLVQDWPMVLGEIARVTEVEFLTVLEHQIDRPDLMEEYRQGAEAEGVRTGPPGLSERTLAERLAPDRALGVASARYRAVGRSEVASIARRAFRDTWPVPDELHRRLVRSLGERYLGAEISVTLRVEVCGWAPARLAAFAAKAEAASDVRP